MTKTAKPKSSFQLPPSLESFLDKLLQDKFPNGSSLNQENTKEDLRPLLIKSINLGLISALPPMKQQQLKQDMQKDGFTQDKLQAYFTKHIDKPEMVTAQALITFKKRYLGIA
jgi:hypothetical protein